ncbi:MAG: PHP domain-containing protein [Methanomassiliicoccus sp.]|nr:PHP domain-containing protein [Methanomassiliicoccus sp.]
MRKATIVIIALIVVASVSVAAVYLPRSNDGPSDTTPRNETPTDGVVVYDPYASGGQWFKGQMHCHSTQSDGALAPRDVVSRYADLGYDFIALTDHERITKVTGSILVLGQEYGKGSAESTGETHMNGINISYVPYKYALEQERVDNMTAQGGIVTLNHPAYYKYAYEDEVMAELTNYTCLEIANGYYVSMTTIEWWDDALTSGKTIWGLAADDAHGVSDYDKGWIVVRTSEDLTTDSIIDAIKRGSFYASTGAIIDDVVVAGSNITVSTPGADNIRFFGSEGKLLAAFNGSQATYHFNGTEGYVRAVVGANDGWGWTQPIFVGAKVSVQG